MSRKFLVFAWFAVAVLMAGFVQAQAGQAKKPVSQGAVASETAVIDAIDSTNRLVTLKGEDGVLETIYCGPEVQRFDALRVGDKVTFRYHESVVYAIQKAGGVAAGGDKSAITRAKGPKPGGTISRQMTATVTVLAIDQATPSITISTEDGRKMSFKVEEKKNLEGVKAGDKVQITYTQALAISVETPKK
jgi:Cu/Ag efflux protein CusF